MCFRFLGGFLLSFFLFSLFDGVFKRGGVGLTSLILISTAEDFAKNSELFTLPPLDLQFLGNLSCDIPWGRRLWGFYGGEGLGCYIAY